jgi:hypothetical protein
MKNWIQKNVLRMKDALPMCGAYIRFKQGPGRGGQAFGEFTFRSADVEEVLVAHLAENPHLLNDQDGAILRWVQNRDSNSNVSIDIPDNWWRFQYTANKLLQKGHGELRCLKCSATVTHEQLPTAEDQSRGNWVFSTFRCPKGHTLLDVETVHFYVRR